MCVARRREDFEEGHLRVGPRWPGPGCLPHCGVRPDRGPWRGDAQDRDVERAAAKVIDGDHAWPARAPINPQPVRERRRGRLRDQTHDLQARKPARDTGCLALGVIEVRGDRHHRSLHGTTQGRLGPGLERAQDLGGDLLGASFAGWLGALARDSDTGGAARPGDDLIRQVGEVRRGVLKAAAHEALHRSHRGPWMVRRGRLGRAPHHGTVLLISHHARQERVPICPKQDARLPAGLRDCNQRVRGTEVDADDHLRERTQRPSLQNRPRTGVRW